ncbi:gluconate 2-dehydrogenase subunit 3 family protein [Pseudarthrobacter oxydans]|uniref:gluconate 2-dehydrogenase subunit 3 family protein n=1 Tax=Pseudarthrobacter oxydans TaxID=1671 RepID=UPI0034185BA5
MFFDEHEWETIDAATARIFPTDHDPGAREARAVRYIDRYLSGIGYIFATADGTGFLRMDGRIAEAWEERIIMLRTLYRDGIRRLDQAAQELFSGAFVTLSDEQQDAVLEVVAGTPKASAVEAGQMQPYGTTLQSVSDHNCDFFSALALHTRQGFYGDPAYGGNKNRVGWQMIGFPGPESLAETNDCTYSVRSYLIEDVDWAELIPHLRNEALEMSTAEIL